MACAPRRSAGRPERAGPLGVIMRTRLLLLGAVAILASRIPFLPPTVEDIDSVNFALALDSFNPALHQPHPPGYPLFVASARLIKLLVRDSLLALCLTSVLSQSVLLLPLWLLLRRLTTPTTALYACLLFYSCPLVWLNGVRPMSDSFGLLLTVATQTWLLAGWTDATRFRWASALAGLVPGARLQALLLTWPLWLVRSLRRRDLFAACALALGLLIWLIPVCVASGGVNTYLRSFTLVLTQAVDTEPLVGAFNLNRGARVLVRAFLAPWGANWLGMVVSALCAIGIWGVWRRAGTTLAWAAVLFLPYLAFHILIQETRHLRYALAYMPLVAWLAAEGLALLARVVRKTLERPLGLACVGALTGCSALMVLPALQEYHVTPSPPMAAVQALAAYRPAPGAIGNHYAFNRYLDWWKPPLATLKASPGGELGKLAEYWRAGGRARALFLTEDQRTDLATVAPDATTSLNRWQWPAPVLRFLSGTRPRTAELYAIDPPRWFTGLGWRLSLEGVTETRLRTTPRREAYLMALAQPTFLMIGGGPTAPDARDYNLDLNLEGRTLARYSCEQPLLEGFLLPPAAAATPARYLTLTAITSLLDREQGSPFSLNSLAYDSTDNGAAAFGSGWFHPERDRDGRLFRWLGPQGRLLIHLPPSGASLELEGSLPLGYLGTTRIAAKTEAATLDTLTVESLDFSWRIDLPARPSDSPFVQVALDSDRSFVPDEIQHNGDTRRLTVRIYSLVVRAQSAATQPAR
jgi:hypothetical protein